MTQPQIGYIVSGAEIEYAVSTMNFITYNLLSATLRTNKSFPECNPAWLDARGRFDDILTKLKSIIMTTDENTVFGLQEVSLCWVTPLTEFFNGQDYEFHATCYGSKFTGYMGVGLAYPRANRRMDKLNVMDIEYACPPQDLGERGFKRWKRAQKEANSKWYRASLQYVQKSLPFQPILQKFLAHGGRPLQTMITHRYNRAIFGTVTHPKFNTCCAVGVYHMPCMFRYPEVMAVHILLFFDSLRLYCEAHDLAYFIVLMDGNIQPGILPYRILGDRYDVEPEEMDAIDAVSPGILEDDRITDFIGGMKHAYPTDSITNYTVAFTGNEFCGKIDYIWHKMPEGVTVDPATDIAPIETIDTQGDYLPNAQEPSDHYMLAATIDLSH